MIDVKVSVSITLPGRVMYSYEEAKAKDLFNHESVSFSTKRNGIVSKETVYYNTRQCKPAILRVNISSSQYEMMLSSCPDRAISKFWKSWSKDKKVREHLKRMCEDLGGISFDYIVFED